MKIIITGATGTAGSEVLRQALADPHVKEICVLSRRKLDVEHDKLTVVLQKDFTDYSKSLKGLEGYDACLWCLGVSQNDVSKKEYIKITYDYAITAAEAMRDLNKKFVFCFLSGQGADSREKSWIRFARVKGQTENDLFVLGKPKVYCFRPAYIHPINTKPKKWFERVAEPITPFLYHFLPFSIVSTVELAKAMLNVARLGNENIILENEDIRKIARGVEQ